MVKPSQLRCIKAGPSGGAVHKCGVFSFCFFALCFHSLLTQEKYDQYVKKYRKHRLKEFVVEHRKEEW
mgnify:CR=1 FL=1